MRGLTDEQRAERAKGIGGSDAGRIMAGEWRQLWLEKTGRAQGDDLSWSWQGNSDYGCRVDAQRHIDLAGVLRYISGVLARLSRTAATDGTRVPGGHKLLGTRHLLIIAGLLLAPPAHADVAEWFAKLTCDQVYRFAPEPGITAYQLAVMLAHARGSLQSPICVSNSNPIPSDLLNQFVRLK